ncbi:MAG TPA: rhomboid family intramembrane serine protease [Tepidisphaeraceae bacterium]|nr:rhomboid family intramembrane serine protease [Tepidisphaeraceae bacterium]
MAWENRPYYRDDPGFRTRFGFTAPTPVAWGLIIACIALFVVQAATGDFRHGQGLSYWGGLTFRDGKAFIQPWRWISYQYLHGSASHIFFNLIGIYFLVPPVERIWGGRNTFIFYTLGGIAAGVLYGIINLFIPSGLLVGASGSIFAMLGALALLMPDMQILLFFVIPISIRALAVLLGLLWFLVVISAGDPSAAAHLGGLAFGFAGPYFGRGAWSNFAANLRRSRERREVAAERAETEQIDAILQKVHDHGMNSLSRRERSTLKKATERQRQREVARARRR